MSMANNTKVIGTAPFMTSFWHKNSCIFQWLAKLLP